MLELVKPDRQWEAETQTPNGMGAPHLRYAAEQKHSAKSPPWPKAPEPSRTVRVKSYGAKGAVWALSKCRGDFKGEAAVTAGCCPMEPQGLASFLAQKG